MRLFGLILSIFGLIILILSIIVKNPKKNSDENTLYIIYQNHKCVGAYMGLETFRNRNPKISYDYLITPEINSPAWVAFQENRVPPDR